MHNETTAESAYSPAKSEYANVVVLKSEDSSLSRCHSYSGPRIELNKTAEQNKCTPLIRTESEASYRDHKSGEPADEGVEASDFRTRLASIQNLLNQKEAREKTVVK